MGDFEKLLQEYLTRGQIKYMFIQLVEQGILDKTGEGRGTEYIAGKRFEELKNRGKISEK